MRDGEGDRRKRRRGGGRRRSIRTPLQSSINSIEHYFINAFLQEGGREWERGKDATGRESENVDGKGCRRERAGRRDKVGIKLYNMSQYTHYVARQLR